MLSMATIIGKLAAITPPFEGGSAKAGRPATGLPRHYGAQFAADVAAAAASGVAARLAARLAGPPQDCSLE